MLVNAFLHKFADLGSSIRLVSDDAMQCLLSYNRPGNVRELENAVEHALARGVGPTVELSDLPSSVQSSSGLETLPEENGLLTLDKIERRAIFRALTRTHGDRVAAAHILHIGKTTLYRKLKRYGAKVRGHDLLGYPGHDPSTPQPVQPQIPWALDPSPRKSEA